MIDIHCHLLPGIDDGPAGLADALALANALEDDGISHAVCTPHVFPGRFENRRSSIGGEFDVFSRALQQHGIGLSIAWAGEVRLCGEIVGLLETGELPSLGRSDGMDNMLLEFPDGQVPLGSDRLISALLRRHIRPVIVHPERNREVMEKPDRLARFVEMGCAVQLTAGSLVGDFGKKAQATAEHMLKAGWVTAVASDAHNLRGRAPRMSAAHAWLEEHHGPRVAHRLTLEGPAWLCGLTV